MRKITTLTGKNIPRLSVARGGEPDPDGVINRLIDHMMDGTEGHYLPNQWYLSDVDPVTDKFTITPIAVEDFTRVCDDMGLKLRDEK